MNTKGSDIMGYILGEFWADVVQGFSYGPLVWALSFGKGLSTRGPHLEVGLLSPPNYPLRHPKYHLTETIRPLMEVHWGVQANRGP